VSFSRRFNQWLIDKGKEPVSEEFAADLDAAWERTKRALQTKRYKSAFVQGFASLVADAAAGRNVDPAQYARHALDRAEREERPCQ
jgi:hypothetical protein